MAYYKVACVNEKDLPLQGVNVEAVRLSTLAVSQTQPTGDDGVAAFFNLTGPHWFRPLARRTGTAVGERSYTGDVRVQIVAFSSDLCVDFVVSADAAGTHTTLAAAVAEAITSAGTSGTRTIWVCDSLTEGNIEVGGMGTSARIVIMSHEARRVILTSPANQDIFVQSSSGGTGDAAALHFKNIGFDPDTVNNRAIFYVNTGSEIRRIIYEECFFNDGFPARGDTSSMGGMEIQVKRCTGAIAGFFLTNNAGGTFAPDSVQAYYNELVLTRWWRNLSTNQDPNFVQVLGGFYQLANSLTIADGDQFHFQDFVIWYTGTGAIFITDPTSSNINNLSFQGIIARFSTASGYFGEFGSAAINNNNGLFLKNISGFPITGLTITATNFINVDTDYLNVHAGNLLAHGGWTNTYVGPNTGYGGDHGTLGGLADDDHTIYLRLAGRAGGQIVFGGTAAGDDLTFISTSHATPGHVAVEGHTFLISGTQKIVRWDTGDEQSFDTATNTYTITIATVAGIVATPTSLTVHAVPVTVDRILSVVAVSQTFSGNIQPKLVDFPSTSVVTANNNFPGVADGVSIIGVNFATAFLLDNVGNSFFMAALFSNTSSWINVSTEVNNFGPLYVLNDQFTFTADTQALTSGLIHEIYLHPTLTRVNGGTLTVTQWNGLNMEPTIDTGVTVVTRRGILFRDYLGSGAVTTQLGIDISALTKATTNIGIRNASTMRQVAALTIGADAAAASGFILDVQGGDIRLGAAAGDTVQFSVQTSLPATPAANFAWLYPFTTTARDVPFATDDGGFRYAMSEEVRVVIPQPVALGVGVSVNTVTTTSARVGLVKLTSPMLLSEITYAPVIAGTANAVVRIALYTEDGQNLLVDVTDAVGTSVAERNVDVTNVWLWPGHYYIFFCLSSGTTAPQVAYFTTFNAFFTGGAGEPDLEGALTIVGGAAPATFAPTAITTPAINSTLFARFDAA